MRLFDFLVPKPKIEGKKIPQVIEEMDRRLKATREQFVFAALSSLESEGCEIPGGSKHLVSGTEIDSALRGFQLTTVVGFSWDYMDASLYQLFDQELTRRLDGGHAETVGHFREAYLDCEGNADRITERLTADIFRLWGNPQPRQRILNALTAGARVLGIMSQAGAAMALGDAVTERELRKLAAGG